MTVLQIILWSLVASTLFVVLAALAINLIIAATLKLARAMFPLEPTPDDDNDCNP